MEWAISRSRAKSKLVTETELAWLAGLWDGEGSITIFTHKERNGAEKICPTLLVVNTNESIIAEAVRILDALGTSFHVFERKMSNPKWKDSIQLNTRNTGYIKTALEAMLPYLIGKKPQAQLVLRYVNKKLGQMIAAPGRTRYDSDDRSVQQQVQAMNRTGKSDTSTTTGETPAGDDIV
ncbi:MAG: hypothetical protein ACREBU_25295 [Nitrososphaera sp.]